MEPRHPPAEPDAPGRGAVLALAGVVLAAWALLLFARGLPADVSALFADRLPANPYVVPEHALRLYVLLPATVLAACVLWAVPGIALFLAFGRAERWDRAVVVGCGAAFGVQVAVGTAWMLLAGSRPEGGTQTAVAGATAFAAVLLLGARAAAGRASLRPLGRSEAPRIALSLAIPFVATAALLPVLFWQNLNDDGWEAQYLAESLRDHVLPRWPVRGGMLGLGAGMLAPAWLGHWFHALFGPLDAAPRLPFVLTLPAVASGILALAEWGRPRRLRAVEVAAAATALGAYALVLSLSAGYDPYFCDISSPAAFDTFFIALVLGAIVCLVHGSLPGFLALGVAAQLARPTALLLFGMLCAAALLTREGRQRRWALHAAAAAGLCLLVTVGWEKLVVPALRTGESVGYDAGSLLARYRFLTVTDVGRLAFLVVPTGFVPVIALFAWRRQDALARTLALVTVLYFAAFFVPAFVSAHHYVPVMLLPLVVAGRVVTGLEDRPSRIAGAAALVGAVAGFLLSVPPRAVVDRTYRDLARRLTVVGVPDQPDREDARRPARALREIVPDEDHDRRPDEALVGAPWALYHYARRGRPDAETWWVLQPEGWPPPDGFHPLGTSFGFDVHGRGEGLRLVGAVPPPATDFAAAPYALSRGELHRHIGVPRGRYDLDLEAVLRPAEE